MCCLPLIIKVCYKVLFTPHVLQLPLLFVPQLPLPHPPPPLPHPPPPPPPHPPVLPHVLQTPPLLLLRPQLPHPTRATLLSIFCSTSCAAVPSDWFHWLTGI